MRMHRFPALLGLVLVLLASPPLTRAESPEEIAAIANAAERGNQGAQLLLGLIYREGRGVPRDAAKALYWLEQAARERQPYAAYALGQMYAAGEGTARDTAKAIDWWRVAADEGFAPAQLELGRAYLDGRGTRQHYRET